MSRAARLYDELGAALVALRPVVAAARRTPDVDGDYRTILCNRWRRAESVRAQLLEVLHTWRPGVACPEAGEVTRTAACLVAAIATLVDEGPGRGCDAGGSAPGRVARG